MAAAVSSAGSPATSNMGVSRSVRLVRVAVLLLGGIGITFSATLHEQLRFDLVIAAVMLAALGAAHLVQWAVARAAGPVALLLAITSLIAAAALPFQSSPIAFALVIAAWALVCALLEFVGEQTQPGTRQDATLIGASGVLLAVLTLLLRQDEVAVIGLLGAYAIVSGVFLGISAFDIRRAGASELDLSGDPRPEHIAP